MDHTQRPLSNASEPAADPVAAVVQHYGRGGLWQRLEAALRADGVDPAHPSAEALAPYDQLHGRGIEATEELARLLEVSASHHLLDVGSGIGGPARTMAMRFGCRVTGLDITEEYCQIARRLARAMALEERVRFEVGDALAMPFPAQSFDGAYSMNVSMNIADKSRLLSEIARVLKPGGWFALSELALGPGAPPEYPMPWAGSPAASFLLTPQESLRTLEAGGFSVVHWRNTTMAHIAFAARQADAVSRGGRPLQRSVPLLQGDTGALAARNATRAVAQGSLIPVEIYCRLGER